MSAQQISGPHYYANVLVETLFDTGAMGCSILYGRVVKSGPKRFTVQWESGFRNSLAQGDHRIKIAGDQETARAAIAKAEGRA